MQLSKDSNRNSGDSERLESSNSQPNSPTNKTTNRGVMNEGVLRKKLKQMCARPKRTIIQFLDDEKDMSLFTFLRTSAKKFN